MQFISNKISVGKTKSFEDICQEYLEGKNAKVKTASVTEEVKVAEADEAEGSGQLEVEPLHQEGESTNQDSVAGGKGDGDGGSAPTKESDKEGESSGQPEAEGKKELNNDPKVQADSDSEIKEAGEKGNCDGCGKPNFLCKCDKGECEEEEDKEEGEDKKSSTKSSFVKIANLTQEEKARLGKFWRNIYPDDFVDAMLADK